ncbi:hypothetical protein INS49_003712 [Diaporthe citri]|uniref:uncharacterized protein n=1 Tax=Diaporthe citri TaxID=83186 RepID=UPI001C7FABE1|nr:uncharacterized protein INS49_003712 [Diaporthe citri]KAG6355746.1 hypothetical protein INS49_003712 [Diaporthe citri]
MVIKNKVDYDLEVLDRPGMTQSVEQITTLRSQLCQLGKLCFDPLPNYQVFEYPSSTSFHDKIIVLAKQGDELIAFLSAVILPVSGLKEPVVHTGLTVIHPSLRKSGVIHSLFAAFFLHLFSIYPKGLWLSTLSGIVTSLGHIATYTSNVFPSPQWKEAHPAARPSDIHLRIAREISAKYRQKMHISPEAHFDESAFVFRAQTPTRRGISSADTASVLRQDHRNMTLTRFYRGLLRDPGDEVLQISYFDPGFTFGRGADVSECGADESFAGSILLDTRYAD